MGSPRYCIVTDLEGVAGVDSYSQTDTYDEEQKGEAMTQLAAETNACISGINDVTPSAEIHVTDMHGTGGFRPDDIEGAECKEFPITQNPFTAYDYDAVLFVGMHAMAGTPFAPLAHTYDGKTVDYYRLNGTYIGEFAGLSFMAGLEGTPAIFLASDDKTTLEAQQFVPEIETTVVKKGKGLERAEHLDKKLVCERIRERTATAVRRRDEIPPLAGFESPYVVEIRYKNPDQEVYDRWRLPDVDIEWIDDRTIQLRSETFDHIYP